MRDGLLLALEVARLEYFTDMGRVIEETSQKLNIVGNHLIDESIASIKSLENMEEVADELEDVVRDCKKELRKLLRYLNKEVKG